MKGGFENWLTLQCHKAKYYRAQGYLTFPSLSQSTHKSTFEVLRGISLFSFVIVQLFSPPYVHQNTLSAFKTLLPLFVRPHRGKLLELDLASPVA